jgi:copper ion binding protein
MESPKSDLTTILLVNNIHCPSCVSYAEEVLRPLSDISKVTISIVSHEIRLEHHRARTAHVAIQELGEAAFEIQHVTTTDNAGRVVGDYDTAGDKLKKPLLYTWPLFMSRAQRKHIKNCTACQMKTKNQPQKAKIWAAITRRDTLFDEEKQDFSTTRVDRAASTESTDEGVLETRGSNSPDSSEYTAFLSIGGMTCVSCSGSITKELEALDFVTNVNINLLTNSGTVTYHGSKENCNNIVEAIEDIGYEVSIDDIRHHSAGNRSQPLSHKFVASLSIEGMTCGSCVGTITEGLQVLPFIHEVNIDLVGNSGNVEFEGKHNIDKIRKRFDDLGYSATVVELQQKGNVPGDAQSVPERTITIAVEGMYCEHCPEKITSALENEFRDSMVVENPLTLQDPKIRIRYKPSPPDLTVRRFINTISSTHEAFSAKIWHPPSIEERSRAMQHHEQRRILARLIFTFLVAIPTLVVGVVYMSLVPASDSTKMWFEEPVWAGNVSRTEWALFIMTTPIMFFGADFFHTRAFKELRALWRPGSRVPILRRFYRFGSMNLLISAGTSVAYFSSVAVLILDARATPQHVMGSQSMTYFDSVTFLSFFILIGKFLEAYSKAKTGDTVAMLSKLRPDEAILVESASKGSSDLGATESEVSQHVQVDALEVGDKVKVLLPQIAF